MNSKENIKSRDLFLFPIKFVIAGCLSCVVWNFCRCTLWSMVNKWRSTITVSVLSWMLPHILIRIERVFDWSQSMGWPIFNPFVKKNIVKIKLVDWKYNFEVFNSFLHYIKVYKVLYTKALLYLRSLFQRMVAMPCYDLAATILILIKTVEEKASLNVSKLECWLQVSKAKNN